MYIIVGHLIREYTLTDRIFDLIIWCLLKDHSKFFDTMNEINLIKCTDTLFEIVPTKLIGDLPWRVDTTKMKMTNEINFW